MNRTSKKITKKLLIRLYIKEQLSLPQTARKLKLSRSTVGRYLKKFNIAMRSISEGTKIWSQNYTHNKNCKCSRCAMINGILICKNYKNKISKKLLIELYIVKKLSCLRIAKKLKVHYSTILNYLKFYKIDRRDNVSCQGFIRGKHHPNYRNGNSFIDYPIEFRPKRLKIRQRDNCTCQNCGMNEEEHLKVFGQVLHVHHIDYNKHNCHENNLITVCIRCNGKANSNRTYWEAFYYNKILEMSQT